MAPPRPSCPPSQLVPSCPSFSPGCAPEPVPVGPHSSPPSAPSYLGLVPVPPASSQLPPPPPRPRPPPTPVFHQGCHLSGHFSGWHACQHGFAMPPSGTAPPPCIYSGQVHNAQGDMYAGTSGTINTTDLFILVRSRSHNVTGLPGPLKTLAVYNNIRIYQLWLNYATSLLIGHASR